jgi:hypothetical protein
MIYVKDGLTIEAQTGARGAAVLEGLGYRTEYAVAREERKAEARLRLAALKDRPGIAERLDGMTGAQDGPEAVTTTPATEPRQTIAGDLFAI